MPNTRSRPADCPLVQQISNEKKQRLSKCANCFESITGESYVVCSDCGLEVHCKKSCSGYTSIEIQRNETINVFKCNKCSKRDGEVEMESDAAENGDHDERILSKIYKELVSCRQDLYELRRENAILREQNSVIISSISSIEHFSQKIVNSNHRNLQHGGAGRSERGRRKTPSRERGRSDRRKVDFVGLDKSQRTPLSTPKNNNNNNQRNVNSRVIHDDKIDQSRRSQILASLPTTKIKLYSKNVFVSLKNSEANSEIVFKHLKKNNVQVSKVTAIIPKYDHYRCFVITCKDLDFNDVMNPDLWYENSVVKEFTGSILVEKTIDSFPNNA